MQNGPRFLALGDSYTIGESVAAGDRWPSQLVDNLRKRGISVADPEIIARTGWSTDELGSAIDEARPEGRYALVTLLIGVNNQYRGRSVDEYRTQFRALLQQAVSFAGGEGARVIVISIPDWGATPFARREGRDPRAVGTEIEQFNRVAREETAAQAAAWIDITPISLRAAVDPSLNAADGLHPSAEMYRQWVELIEPEAIRILSLASTANR